MRNSSGGSTEYKFTAQQEGTEGRADLCFSLWTFARFRVWLTPEHGRTLARPSRDFPAIARTFGPTRAEDGAAVAIGLRHALP